MITCPDCGCESDNVGYTAVQTRHINALAIKQTPGVRRLRCLQNDEAPTTEHRFNCLACGHNLTAFFDYDGDPMDSDTDVAVLMSDEGVRTFPDEARRVVWHAR